MYRPEEWKGYHCVDGKCIECDTNPVDCNNHYEAGADAMLEGLKKECGSLEWTGNTARVTLPKSEGKGHLVFIPEEEPPNRGQ